MNKILNFHNTIKDTEYLNSYNIARKSNKVFAETISHQQFKKLNLLENSYKIYEENKDYLTYRMNNLKLDDGDIVFCKTEFIFELFSILYKVHNKLQIYLITHQAAQPSIDKNLFLLKPNCVKKWYSINVDYNHPNLIPIPLGIANDYSFKNINISDFKNNVKYLNFKKEFLAYLNFKPDTNEIKRNSVIHDYSEANWVFKNNDITLKQYMEELAKSNYVFTPPGWGIDTHRFWEVLYLGAIPIAEYSVNSSMFNIYPVIYYDNNQTISESDLAFNYESKFKDLDLEKLTISWWFQNIIKSSKNNSGKSLYLKYKFTNKIIKRYINIKLKYFEFRFKK